MKFVVLVAILVAMMALSAAANTFISVSMSSIANQPIGAHYQGPPTGQVTLGGIPFFIPPEGNNVFETSVEGLGVDWPTSATIGTDISNPLNAYMLITGTAVSKIYDGQMIGCFTFHFASGNSTTFDLIAGDTIRDWVYHDSLVMTTSNPNVSTVWNGLNTTFPYYPAVLNMLVISLSPNDVLTGIDIIDTSGSTTGNISPGLFLSGITIETNPVPESSSLLALGAGIITLTTLKWRKKR